jgi:hypothetical protein
MSGNEQCGRMGRKQVITTVMRLLQRSGPVPTLNFTLADQSRTTAMPIGIQLRGYERRCGCELHVTLLNPLTGVERHVAARDIVNIEFGGPTSSRP